MNIRSIFIYLYLSIIIHETRSTICTKQRMPVWRMRRNPKIRGKITVSRIERLNNLSSIVTIVKSWELVATLRHGIRDIIICHIGRTSSRSSQLRTVSSTESIKYKAPQTCSSADPLRRHRAVRSCRFCRFAVFVISRLAAQRYVNGSGETLA